MNRRLFWIGAVTACLSTSVLFARQGVIKTRDGRTLEGDIEEKPDQVTIVLHGIRTSINRNNIEGEVQYFDNVQDRYQAKRAQLPKKPTAADHLALARWCYEVKAYDLALKEIDQAKAIDPNSAEAATLEQTVISQRRLEMNRRGPGDTSTGRTPADNTAPHADTGATGTAHYLTPQDINTIRQYEWREKDTTVPRAVVPADVRKRYVDMKALDPGKFAALSMPQQAYYILSDPDAPAEMKKDIKITTDPQSIATYRRAVQPLILNNCATAGCHGGQHAGRFMLYTHNPDRDEVAYTNFYILQNYKQNFGDTEYWMLDRTYPERSILAQFALSPDAAELKHPAIKGHTYKPIAASKAAPGYQTIVGWMKQLQAGEPKYGIKYDLPGAAKNAPAPADQNDKGNKDDKGDTTTQQPPARPATPARPGVPPARR
jgi:hypothetical protein